MKKQLLLGIILLAGTMLLAQNDKAKYPEPEFSNEVSYLKKDSVHSLVRLEKGNSKLESKTKMGGFGGYESGYILENEKSTVRLPGTTNPSFIFSNGSRARSSSPLQDSIMRANGMDPAMADRMGSMDDPSNTINLYKAESGKGKRKILMQKTGGAFGGKKPQSSDKFSFSVKKIREGYWELVIDKPLPKGEYAFSLMGIGAANMDGSATLFSFAID